MIAPFAYPTSIFTEEGQDTFMADLIEGLNDMRDEVARSFDGRNVMIAIAPENSPSGKSMKTSVQEAIGPQYAATASLIGVGGGGAIGPATGDWVPKTGGAFTGPVEANGLFTFNSGAFMPDSGKFYFDAGAAIGTEYIAALNDGHLDIVANTSVGIITGAAQVTIGPDNILTEMPIKWSATEYITSMGVGYLDIYAATSIDLNAAVVATSTVTATSFYVSDGGTFGISGNELITVAADGTFTVSGAHLLLASTNQMQFGDSGTYIYQSADSILGYVADGYHEFTGGSVHVGTMVSGHGTDASGELHVAGISEFDGYVYMDSDCWISGLTPAMRWYDSGVGYTFVIQPNGTHGQVFFGLDTPGGRQLVIGLVTWLSGNYDHATQTNPTLFVHSATDPDDANDEWWSITHDTTDAVYSRGSGVHKFDTDIQFITATDSLKWSANEYITSGAAGYSDVYADVDVRIYGGLDCTEIIKLPTTSATVGYITQNGDSVFHTYGTQKNIFIGRIAGNFTNTGQYNAAVGDGALKALTDGTYNLGIGASALLQLTGGDQNVCVGGNTGYNLTATNWNTFIGGEAGFTATGAECTAIGGRAMYLGTSANYNTMIGYKAGYTGTTFDNNVFIGYKAGYYETGSSKLFIDNALRASEADGRVKALMYGIFDAAIANQSLLVNGILKSSYGGSFGDGGTANYVGISAAGDLLFHGTGGLAFAELWVLGNAVVTTIAGAGTFAQFVGFGTDGQSNDAVPAHAQDHITITTAGKYLVVASFHVESIGAGAADIVSIEIRTNNGTVTFSNLHAHRKLAGGGGDIGSISISGIADLAATDTVEVWLTNDDNATDILVADANLSVVQVGGT